MHVRNQHIVPEFLLKNFSSDNSTRIWSFDKNAINERWSNEKERAISQAPTEEFFYDEVKGIPEGSYEYILRENENDASLIINRLYLSKDLNTLLANDKKTIAKFVCFQWYRTKYRLDHTVNSLKQFTELTKESVEIDYEKEGRDYWFDIFSTIDVCSELFIGKTWCLAESDDDFFISDNPVIFQNIANNRKHRGNLGLNTLGVEIYLPISSSLILCMLCPLIYPHPLPNIKCVAGNVENFNSLQVKFSTRFIFSKKRNFELIYDMISKNEL